MNRSDRVDPEFVLVASPFTGPFVWSEVARVLRGRGRRVLVHGVDAAIDDGDFEHPVVFVAHSGGGPRVPALAARTRGVIGVILVDALLPHPGRSWAQTVPEAFAIRLKAEAVAGRLPPWPQWWGESRLRELLPDDDLREEFVRACPAVPVSEIDEVVPEHPEPPAVFVQLSETYAPETATARTRGWPVLVLDAHHLALLTDPGRIADAILEATAAF